MKIMLYTGVETEGGLLKHVRLLARGLLAAGHEVILVLSPAPGADRLACEGAATGARVVRLTVAGKWDLSNQRRLRRLVAAERPEIFHLHLSSPVEGIPAILAAKSVRAARLVTTEHAPSWSPLRRWYSASLKRLISRLVDAIIVTSGSDARFLRAEFGIPEPRIHTIPNGVPGFPDIPTREEARARLGLPLEGTVVGYLGALETKKGLLDLVDAGSECAVPDLTIVLAGQGGLSSELTARAASAPFRLVLPGRITAEDVGVFLASLDIFAFPSHQEAMPLALLEAMSAGLPIVATRVGGIPEILDDGVSGILVEPARPGDLAGALDRLAEDRAAASAMGAAARRVWSERFGDRRMVEDHIGLYRELCGVAGPAEPRARSIGTR